MSDRIKLEIDGAEPTVQPGASASITLVVHNTSTIVDQYSIQVDGMDSAWFSVSPTSVSLFPGDQSPVNIDFRPPASTDTVAGSHPFTITATSQDNPAETSQLTATLTVRPFGDFSLSVAPEKFAGRRANYKLTLANTSNADIPLSFSARDEEEALDYTFEWDKMTVPAGGSVDVGLDVRSKRSRLTGEAQQHRLTVAATREGHEELEPVDALVEFEYHARFGVLPKLPVGKWRWLLLLIPILALAAYLAWPIASEELAKLRNGGTVSPTPVSAAASPTAAPNQPTSTPVQPPVVVSFDAVPQGTPQALGLYWQVERATTVVAKFDAGTSGDAQDVPFKSGKYSITASNIGGQDSDSLSLIVVGPPVIVQYFASPQIVKAGQAAKLIWTVIGADDGSVEGKVVDLSKGSVEIKPEQSGSYILRARNAVGEVSSIVYLDVIALPTATPTASPTATPTAPPASTPTSTPASTPTRTPVATPTIPPSLPAIRLFTANPAAIASGGNSPVTLAWQTVNATNARIYWTDAKGEQSFIPTLPSGTRVVYPVTTGPTSLTFNMEAFGSAGRTSGVSSASVTSVAPVSVSRLINTSRCSGNTMVVDLSWVAVGGKDATIELYRSGQSRPIFTGTVADLSRTFTDRPPSGPAVSYTLIITNSAGAKASATTPPPPGSIGTICIN